MTTTKVTNDLPLKWKRSVELVPNSLSHQQMYSQCIDIVRDIAKACENNPEKFREFAEMVKQFHDDLLEDLQKQEPQHEGTLVSSNSATE